MNRFLSNVWWLHATRGASALVLATFVLLWTDAPRQAFAVSFGMYGIITGSASILAAVIHKTSRAGVFVLISGLVSAIAGAITLFTPDIALVNVLLVTAASAIVAGVLDAVLAHGRREIEQEPLLALVGAVLIAFGILIVISTDIAVVKLAYLISGLKTLAGALMLALALRAWKERRQPVQISTGDKCRVREAA